MFGFFNAFKNGCGCALGVVFGLVIAYLIIDFLFALFIFEHAAGF